MNVFATEEFNNKLKLANDTNFINDLSDFINKVELAQDPIEIINRSIVEHENIYAYKISNYRIFYSIIEEAQIPYMLLVDFIRITINPKIRRDRDPRMNNLINPRMNNLINPRMNNLINPRMNNLINPRMNNLINPRMNNLINPRMNNLINPRMNNLINPRITPNHQNFIIYDLNLNSKEFIVDTSHQNVIQIFTFDLDNSRFGIKHSQNGFVVFDLSNNFIGHFESDGQNGYNEFDLDNSWVGIIK